MPYGPDKRFGEIADAAAREQLTHRAFLAELLLAECDDRDSRRAARRIHDAGFPRLKTLAEFDFAANPAINPATIAALAGGAWITKGESLCLIGESGTGKSHCSSPSAPKPPAPAAGSATPWPRSS